jgi:hypothetical protein
MPKGMYYATTDRATRLGNFLPVGLLLEAHLDEVAKRAGIILGYFLFKQFFSFPPK